MPPTPTTGRTEGSQIQGASIGGPRERLGSLRPRVALEEVVGGAEQHVGLVALELETNFHRSELDQEVQRSDGRRRESAERIALVESERKCDVVRFSPTRCVLRGCVAAIQALEQGPEDSKSLALALLE